MGQILAVCVDEIWEPVSSLNLYKKKFPCPECSSCVCLGLCYCTCRLVAVKCLARFKPFTIFSYPANVSWFNVGLLAIMHHSQHDYYGCPNQLLISDIGLIFVKKKIDYVRLPQYKQYKIIHENMPNL